jgi:NTP pyrophosphatase (non-canonical NTP hydrolase)
MNDLTTPIISKDQAAQFETAVGVIQKTIHDVAVAHGWWTPLEGQPPRSDGECLALMHSELSEALEAMRTTPTPESAKIPGWSLEEEELADTIIRILDYAQHHGMDIAGALIAKVRYNASRPYRHGGKLF